MNNEGMTKYTKWWVKYPWHVSDEPVPDDCSCEYCTEKRNKAGTEHKPLE